MTYRTPRPVIIRGVPVPPDDPALAAFGDACARARVSPQDFGLLLQKMVPRFEAMIRRGPVDYAALNDLHLDFQAEASAIGINRDAAAFIGDEVGMRIIASADIALPDGLPVPADTLERIATLRVEAQPQPAELAETQNEGTEPMTEDQAREARLAKLQTYVDQHGNIDWEAANRDPLLADGPAARQQAEKQARAARIEMSPEPPPAPAPAAPPNRADLQERIAALTERVTVGDPTAQAAYEAIMQEYTAAYGTEPARTSAIEAA